MSSPEQHVVIPCDVCGENLAVLDDLSQAAVSWFVPVDPDTYDPGPVEHFHVSHIGVRSCFDRIEATLKQQGFSGASKYFHHLSVFTGSHAMWRMQSLLWDYDWIRRSKAQEKMLDFFALAARLPTTEHGDECAAWRF